MKLLEYGWGTPDFVQVAELLLSVLQFQERLSTTAPRLNEKKDLLNVVNSPDLIELLELEKVTRH